MSMSLGELEAEALELAVEERIQLAKRLLDSIDESPAAEEAAAIEHAWQQEIERRLASYRSGSVASDR